MQRPRGLRRPERLKAHHFHIHCSPQASARPQGHRGTFTDCASERLQGLDGLATSTMRTLLVAQELRRGDGEYAFVDSRRKESSLRLFEDGRTKPQKARSQAKASPGSCATTPMTRQRTRAWQLSCTLTCSSPTPCSITYFDDIFRIRNLMFT